MKLPDHPFFTLPQKVSRVYPLLAALLMVSGSGALYNWQLSLLSADTAVRDRDSKIAMLEIENTNLTQKVRQSDQTIIEQKQTLQSIEQQLQNAKDSLAVQEAKLAQTQSDLESASTQLSSQSAQLAANATELAKLRDRPPLFSFRNTSSTTDRSTEEAAVKALVTKAYEYIVATYGRPYLLNQVTISFVDSFSISAAAGETVITNGPQGLSVDIRMKDFSLNNQDDVTTLIHELIHTFHGIAVFDDAALEEGITVAATDIILDALRKDGHIPNYQYLYLRSSKTQLERWNQTLTIPAGSSAFYEGTDVALRYQLVGSAWITLAQADPNFLLKFNEAYYGQIQKGASGTAALVRKIITEVMPTYDDAPIAQYLEAQIAFNPQ